MTDFNQHPGTAIEDHTGVTTITVAGDLSSATVDTVVVHTVTQEILAESHYSTDDPQVISLLALATYSAVNVAEGAMVPS